MKISAIIAEYNPFHSGHAYHIAKTRQDPQDKIIVIMSGNFVQRGEPAIVDKWARTQMALRGGADMVIELPVHAALSSSEGFAEGAIAILEGLSCIDQLSFGAETADLTCLSEIADTLLDQPEAYRAAFKKSLQSGCSYPKAQYLAITQSMGSSYGDILSLPNNILAIEYLKALKLAHSEILPYAVARRSDYRSTQLQSEFSSAAAIRAHLLKGSCQWQPYLHPEDVPLLQNPVEESSLFQILLYCLRNAAPKTLSEIRGMAEGLENRLFRAAAQAGTYEEFLQLCKTKRFTMARIKRTLLHVLLGISEEVSEAIKAAPLYARVLGVKKESLSLLSLCSSRSKIPIYTQLPRQTEHPSILLDIRASDLYALAAKPAQKSGQDYTQPLILF